MKTKTKNAEEQRNPLPQDGQPVARSTMRDSTYAIVRAALAGDDTVSAADRTAILSFCREPRAPAAAPAGATSLPAESWLTAPQAAKSLGVSLRTVQRLVASGALPSRMLLGCRRIPASALAAPTIAEWPSGRATPAGDCSQDEETRPAV
jgi:excisionase family DNA binding protein